MCNLQQTDITCSDMIIFEIYTVNFYILHCIYFQTNIIFKYIIIY